MLGPDPASTNIACVGGVIANNSGGMRCGVVADSYQTVSALKLVLANGAVIDTAAPGAEEAFAHAAPELAAGLLEIRDELRADAELAARVAAKFEIKNTTGYRLCAFLDADTPLEIFRRLVVGSEGTLAFVTEAVFDTVPLGRHSTLALVGFEDLDGAADAVDALVQAGATATELMVAPTLIAAAYNMPGTPESWKELPLASAALLIEFRARDARGARAPRGPRARDPGRAAADRRGALLPRPRGDRDAVAGARGDAGAAGGDAPARRADDHRGRVRAAGADRRGGQGSSGAARPSTGSSPGWPATPRPATCTSCWPPTSARRPICSATTPSCTSSSS